VSGGVTFDARILSKYARSVIGRTSHGVDFPAAAGEEGFLVVEFEPGAGEFEV